MAHDVVLAAWLMLAAAAPAAAQEPVIAGVVIDARTGRPLEGVLVTIEHQPAVAETDAEGRFRLAAAAGTHVLTASLVGYALLRQRVEAGGAGEPLTLRLSEGAGTFEEHVTVPGRDGAPQPGDAPAAAALYGRDLQALRGVTLDDPLRALHALPSVSATDDFYSEFAVRGLPFRQTGLTVDGFPTSYMMHAVHGVADGGSIAMINSDAVGGLSLAPGSYAQRTGRRIGALAGVTLRDGDRDRLRGRAGLSGTSAGMLLEGPIAGSRGAWLVSARRSYLDWLLKRIDEDSGLAFGFSDVEAKAVIDVTPRHQLQALLIGGFSAFDEQPDDLGVNDEASIRGTSGLAGLTWRYTPSSRVAVTQRVYATGLMHTNRNRAGDVLDDRAVGEFGWRADGQLGLAARSILEFGGDALLLSGRHAQQRSLNDSATLAPTGSYRSTGRAGSAYAQLVLRPSPRVTVTPGLRGDYWSATGTATASPWAALMVTLSPSTDLYAGAGLYHQFPELEQVLGVSGGGVALRPEAARHLDVGLVQRLPRDLSLQATWFARRESDLLWRRGAEPRRLPDGTVQLGRGDAPWVNALSGDARGVELVLRRDVPAGLSGWIGYAYGRYRQTDHDTGEVFWADYDQRHALSLFGQYRFTNRTAIGVKLRAGSNYPIVGYIGEQPARADAPPLFAGGPTLFHALATQRNTLRLPAYRRIDVRVDRTMTWSRRRLTLFAEVANVLDRENMRNVPYGVDRAGRVYGPLDSLLPIVPSAGVLIEF
jgi:hypothetical protein